MHTGLMKVTDGKRYYFAVGNEDQGLLSKEHTFEYKKSASEIKFLSYGDMGVKNSVGSVALMNKRALAKEYDLYVGHFFFCPTRYASSQQCKCKLRAATL